MLRLLRLSQRALSIRARGLDHVCVCVTDIEASISWYTRVLGLQLRHESEPHFYPTAARAPAFLTAGDKEDQSGNGGVALLPLENPAQKIADHQGAHFALRIDQDEFLRASCGALRETLEEHRVHDTQSIEVKEFDYGIQRSLFFSDPDGNIIELASWGY